MVGRRVLAVDVALAVVLTVVAQLELIDLHAQAAPQDARGGYPLDVALTLITTLPVAVRRLWPTFVPAAVFAVVALANVAGEHAQPFFGATGALALLSFTVGRHAAPERARLGWVAGAAWLATFWIHNDAFRDAGSWVFGAAVMLLPWVAGWTINQLHRQRTRLDRALAALAAAEDERRHTALLEERTRIAREMHDVLAHGVSVMVVQTGAARVALPEDAEEVRDGLLSVESTGRRVLQELRRTVGLLREGDQSASVLPAPGFAELPGLAQAMREAGLDVELDIDASPPTDRGRELAVYRVVQEALTNCLRHAGPTRVRVSITGEPDLAVRVEDDGRRGRPLVTGSGGNGLNGLRERVGMYGGRLDAGPLGTGFAVHATIPHEETR